MSIEAGMWLVTNCNQLKVYITIAKFGDGFYGLNKLLSNYLLNKIFFKHCIIR